MEGTEEDLLLRPTVPILCRFNNLCLFSLELYTIIDQQSIIDRGCKRGTDPLKFSQTMCGANLAAVGNHEDWKESWDDPAFTINNKVEVSAASDGLMYVNRTMRIVLRSKKFSRNEIWSNYALDPVNVCF